MFEKNINVVDILQIGVIGLGFLLAFLAYYLLTKEQKQEKPRSAILNSIYVFMFFSVVLCIIGFFSQTEIFNSGQKENNRSQQLSTSLVTSKNNVLYNYFAYSDDKDDIQICNISEFVFSEKILDTDKIYIEGKITGKVLEDNKLLDFEHLVHGYKNQYYLKITHDKGVAFLERNRGDYIGYWIGEVDDPDVNAVICPLVFSPNAKGLSAEEAKQKWQILTEPCRALSSLKEISTSRVEG